MEIRNLYHSGLVVSDLERALDFYVGVLGMRVEREPADVDGEWISSVVGYRGARLRMAYVGVGDSHSIELIQYVAPAAPPGKNPPERNIVGASHVGMIVDDVAAWHKHLQTRGVRFFGPPQLRDAEFPWARYALYFQDPDGNWLEIVERPPRPPGEQAN